MLSSRLGIVAVVSCTIFIFVTAIPADIHFERFVSSAPRDGEVFVLVNTNSGRCLALQDGARHPGAEIVQGKILKHAGPKEHWKFVKNGDSFKLLNTSTKRALAVPQSSTNEGTKIIQWDDLDSRDQQWEFVKVGHHFSVKSRVSGLVLGVSESRTENGAPVIQWRFAEIPDQVWFLRSVSDLDETERE